MITKVRRRWNPAWKVNHKSFSVGTLVVGETINIHDIINELLKSPPIRGCNIKRGKPG